MRFESKMPAEEVARIEAAMMQANGDVPVAARALGLTCKALHNKLRNSAFAGRWGKKEPLPPADVGVTRNIPTQPDVEKTSILNEADLAKLIEREEAVIRKGVEGLGFTGKALDSAMALQRFHRGHFKTVVDLLGGGLTQQFLELLGDIQDCRSIIQSRDLEPEELEYYLRYHVNLLEQASRMYDRAVQASLVSAKIQALRNGGGGKGNTPRRPGFSQLKTVNAPNDNPPDE